MKIPGYCKCCHRIKQVRVSGADLAGLARSGVAQGLCDLCTDYPKKHDH